MDISNARITPFTISASGSLCAARRLPLGGGLVAVGRTASRDQA
jgi:hypothetical protein